MGHWYTTTGQAMHTVIGKNGNERDTTLRDARKLNLIPSVTTQLGVYANEGLTNWRIGSAISAAYSNPPFASEDAKAYHKRILSQGKERSEGIMQFGTMVHDAIEKALSGKEGWDEVVVVPTTGEQHHLASFVNPVVELFADNNWNPVELEHTLVGHGYAGTADVIYTGKEEYGIIDFKTTETVDKPEKWLVKRDYPAQIALYHEAEHNGIGDKAAGYNIFISRSQPGAVKVVRFDAERLRDELAFAKLAVASWQAINKYTPEQ